MYSNKICKYCGKEFNPNSGSQKYCSEECKIEVRKERDRLRNKTESRKKWFT